MTRLSTPATNLGKLVNSLSDFWLATLLPSGETTRAGISRRARASGKRAMAIHASALAANDMETASRAVVLAKELVPYLSAKLIGQAFRDGADAAQRKTCQAPHTSAEA